MKELNKAQIVRDFKQTFIGEHGQRVLEYLEQYCRSQISQSMFDPSSDRQTAYNLGANSVYRHIRFVLTQDPDEKAPDVMIEETLADIDRNLKRG